jgi:glyoxylase-like metal-dependent hydrolase (beta-lactamase superfamily II)
LAGPALGAEEPVSVKTVPVKGTLQVLQGRGGNVLASIGKDGVLLIDSDYGQYAPAYLEALADLAPAADAPRFVLNTHWHGDHTGASPAAALPVVTYGDAMALHFNGADVEIQHYPGGHTDGDSVAYFAQDNVVHMGDLLFLDRFPFVDVDSGGNVFRYIAHVESVLARLDDKTVVIAGHGGPLANKADVQRFRDMLVTTSALVKDKLAQGESLEAITAGGLGEEWSAWEWNFINEAAWISFIAASL